MKTKEELNALKEEVEALNKKLAELSVEELAQVSGGGEVKKAPLNMTKCPFCGGGITYTGANPQGDTLYFNCGNCGDMIYVILSSCWAKW